MEIRGCGAGRGQGADGRLEARGVTTRGILRLLQEQLGDRMLVDKTPSYALDPAVLRRAEEGFEEPLYVHLIRHPYGMIHSFEEAKLDQLFFRREHSFSRRQLAELIWLASHATSRSSWPGCRPRASTGCASRTSCRSGSGAAGALRGSGDRLPPGHGRALQGDVGPDDRRPARRVAHAGRRQVPSVQRGRVARGGEVAGEPCRGVPGGRHAGARGPAGLRRHPRGAGRALVAHSRRAGRSAAGGLEAAALPGPSALGRAFLYRHLVAALGSDQPVYGFQAVGFATRRGAAGDVEEMAAVLRAGRCCRSSRGGPTCWPAAPWAA